MMKRIGDTFASELRVAGVNGLPFSCSTDGALNLNDPRLTDAQRAQIQAVYAAHDPTAVAAPVPDYLGFIRWIPTAFDPPTRNQIARLYPEFLSYCTFGDAVSMAWCITDAKTKGTITLAQYALFQGAVQTFHLPVVLP